MSRGGGIRSGSGNLDILTSGNNDTNFEAGASGYVNFILSDDEGTNIDCFQVTNDGTSRFAYNCINDELECRNTGQFSVNAPWMMSDFLILTTTGTDTCDFPFTTPSPYPGILISDDNMCGNSGLGTANITDGNGILGWGEELTWDFLIDYQGLAQSKSIFDEKGVEYQGEISSTPQVSP